MCEHTRPGWTGKSVVECGFDIRGRLGCCSREDGRSAGGGESGQAPARVAVSGGRGGDGRGALGHISWSASYIWAGWKLSF